MDETRKERARERERRMDGIGWWEGRRERGTDAGHCMDRTGIGWVSSVDYYGKSIESIVEM